MYVFTYVGARLRGKYYNIKLDFISQASGNIKSSLMRPIDEETVI